MNLKQHKRYIPKLIKDALDKLHYERKDGLYVIIDFIHRKEIYFKSDLQKNYGFTEIALSQFKQLIPSSTHLQESINFLIENKLVLRNSFYVMGVKAKGYKIPTEYLGQQVAVFIQNKNINKRITKQILQYRRLKVKNMEFAKTCYFKQFKIDIDGATKAILQNTMSEIQILSSKRKLILSEKQILDIITCRNENVKHRFLLLAGDKNKELNNILHRHMIYSARANAINDGFLFFKRNKTNGRLDSNLTSLPGFLRSFILSTERLVNVDIKNSQPYFLFTVLKDESLIDKTELELYGKLVVDGRFYEYLIEKYKNLMGYTITRNQVKKMLFKIYYSKVSSFPKNKAFFGSIFPSIMSYINKINAVENNTLAIALQKKESESILDHIMPLLLQKDITPYTIHDSFVCTESEASIIQSTVRDELVTLHGIAPSLHMDYIDVIEDHTEEELWTMEELIEELNRMDEQSEAA